MSWKGEATSSLSSLGLPGPREMTPAIEADLSDMAARIYLHCSGRRDVRTGQPYMTWDADLRARKIFVGASPHARPEKLEGLAYTPHMNAAHEVVGTQFQFRFEGRIETFYVGDRVEFTGFQTCITGNEFERVFPIELSEMVTEGQWDAFGQGVTAEVGRHYETVIYPRVVETLLKIGALRGEGPLFVVDLGGGAGGLAEVVCEQAANAVKKVVVVERNPTLVEEARKRAAHVGGRMDVVHSDILGDDVWERLGQAPDVVILCGVVAHQVIEHTDALFLMQSCQRRLARGGFVLVPSYSPALFTSRAYEKMGFAVHNKTLSFYEEGSGALRTNDFYILGKG